MKRLKPYDGFCSNCGKEIHYKYHQEYEDGIHLCRKCRIQKNHIQQYGSLEEYERQRNVKVKQTKAERHGSLEQAEQDRIVKQRENAIKKYGSLEEYYKYCGQTISEGLKHRTEEDKQKTSLLCKERKIEKYGSIEEYNKIVKQNTIKTVREKYGVDNVMYLDSFKEKIKQTSLKKYGTEWQIASKSTRNKIKETCLDRYGTDNPFRSKQIQEKIKITCQEKYGVDYAASVPEIIEQRVNTFQEKYGGILHGSKELSQKIEQTNLKRYGAKNPFASEQIKDKIEQSNLKKYGVTHVGVKFSRYKYDGFTFDSSWELYYYLWLTHENIEFTYKPPCLKFNKRRYYPDFLVKGRYVEIKNDYSIEDGIIKGYKSGEKDYEKTDFLKSQNVLLLVNKDILPIIKEVNEWYGKTFVKEKRCR
jgi:hypothetical protein